MPKIFKRTYILKTFIPKSQGWEGLSHNFWVLLWLKNHTNSLLSATGHVDANTKLTEQMQQVLHCSSGWSQSLKVIYFLYIVWDQITVTHLCVGLCTLDLAWCILAVKMCCCRQWKLVDWVLVYFTCENVLLQVMKASGISIYFNCEDVLYSGRNYQATIEKLKEHVVESADESHYMYSKHFYWF